MRRSVNSFRDRLPDFLRHSDHDTPTPSWREVAGGSASDLATACRIFSGGEATWDSWEGPVRRSVALLIGKIKHEGWIDEVDRIEGWPWDGGFFFRTRGIGFAHFLDLRTSYTKGSIRRGLFAYLSAWNHRGWARSWIQNDAASAALHVGVFRSGVAEAHLDAFNPLFVKGAPRRDLVRIPLVGSYNHRQFLLHRRWEQSEYAAVVRTSANFYHMMRDRVPLSF